jgi:hypothetical protein
LASHIRPAHSNDIPVGGHYRALPLLLRQLEGDRPGQGTGQREVMFG